MDQPAHPHSLISTLFFTALNSIIPLVFKAKVTRLQIELWLSRLVCVETWSKMPDRFSVDAQIAKGTLRSDCYGQTDSS